MYIYIYGIYKEYTRNIHRYLWYKISKNRDPMGWPPHWGAAEGGACVSDYFNKYLWIFFIYGWYMDDIWITSWFNHTAFDVNPIWKSLKLAFLDSHGQARY